ncbi:Hypothetical protein R9X50_00238900 [Acrodontium crateriforme]|uniref:Uncharacterized protein n=1 Tax=Acrodontium crateriforme TaxID=150365 RepID=A0AAQ3M237_9PEZI|nr:Hypothetical protein R9X50_00238900 [Acrodontium crateriforme]
MQFKLLSLPVLAATALAQSDFLSDIPASVLPSVISVLETALPSSLVLEALTNQAAAASDIAAEFETGVPAWYSNLPSGVKSYLPIETASVSLTSAHLPTANATAIFTNSTSSVSGYPTNSANSTLHTTSKVILTSVITTSSTSSESSSASSSAASSAAASSSTSGNGASMPTAAVFGMGAAGIAGLMGVLAL